MDMMDGKARSRTDQDKENRVNTYSTVLLLTSLNISCGSVDIDTNEKDWEEIWEWRTESSDKSPRKCHNDVNSIVNLASISIYEQ